MTGDAVSFLSAIGILCVILIVVTVVYLRRVRASARKTWEGLLDNLISVDRQALETVALDAIAPSGERRTDAEAKELTREQIWELLGGLDGVERLEKNSRVLIEMAAYLQRWHPEAANTAEELRLEAKKLEWHVGRLRAAQGNGSLELHFALYGQNAAVSYYLMVQRLLGLYRENQVPLFGELQRAL
jgi:hypothetical protein